MKSYIGASYLNQNNLKIQTIVAFIWRQIFSFKSVGKSAKIRVRTKTSRQLTSGSIFTTKAKHFNFLKGSEPLHKCIITRVFGGKMGTPGAT